MMLTLGVISTLFFFGAGAFDVATAWMTDSSTVGFFLLWGMWSVNSWCWTLFFLFIGMRFLDYTNKWLQYGQEMIMPFFLLHQPVIVLIAFFVVQWDINLWAKLFVVVLGSFTISVGIYELILKRVGIIRNVLGMK